MKKHLLLLAFSSFSTFAFAQFEDTKYVLGGTVNYGAYETNMNSNISSVNSSFGIAPSIAKVINSNSLLGLQLGYGYSKSGSDIDLFTNTSYSLSVYYQPFYPISDKIFFNWRALGGIGSFQNRNESEFSETKNSIIGLNIGVSPGLSWQVMDRLLLSATIGGASFNKSIHQSSSTDLDSWSFGISFNQPSFAFNYLLK